MNAERLRQLEQVFAEARSLEPARRTSFLKTRCAGDLQLQREVRDLLAAADESRGPLDSAPASTSVIEAKEIARALHEAAVGHMIGRYRVRSILGSGGMGVVYLAEQEKPRRIVALKVIRAGLNAESIIRRFEFEAELLGRLQHPGIAAIIEAGAADTGAGPQPFFAMEYIDGEPLTTHAANRALALSDRLRLMLPVCDAVQHAHQRGVIHRDLKPANIIVAKDGQPKILDFGVARATETREGEARLTIVRTGERQLIGTLAYMSPEQVEGDPSAIDTRSDVYALGVILYELITGRLPHDLTGKSLPEAARLIREEEPRRLSTITTAARGDLDTIIAKALEKDRDRRYASAEALAGDLRRFLSHLPIAARRPSAMYQLRKFARRNPGLVAGSAAALLFLIAGLVSSTIAWRRAIRDRDAAVAAEKTAETQGARSRQMADFLKSTLLSINPTVARGRDTVLLREVLSSTSDRLGAELQQQPELRAELTTIVGEVYLLIGRPKEAEPLLRRALELQGPEARTTQSGHTFDRLGYVLGQQGDTEGAIRTSRAAVDAFEKAGATNTRDGIDARRGLVNALRVATRLPEADALADSVADAARAFTPPNAQLLAECLMSQGMVKSDLGDHLAAERLLREVVGIYETAFGPDDLRTALALTALAADVDEQNRQADAVALNRRALAVFKRVLTDEHPTTSNCKANLAMALRWTAESKEARPLIQEAIETERRLLGPSSKMLGAHLVTLGLIQRAENDDGALATFQEALPILEASAGPESPHTIDVLQNLAELSFVKGDYTGSLAWIDEAIARANRSPRADVLWRLLLRDFRASALGDWAEEDAERGRIAEALDRNRQSRAEMEGIHSEMCDELGGEHWRADDERGKIGYAYIIDAKAMMLDPARESEAIALLDHAEELCRIGADRFIDCADDIPPPFRPYIVSRVLGRMATVYEARDLISPGAGWAERAQLWSDRAEEVRQAGR